MLPRVIALSGWKRSGKDTTASYLSERYGYRPISFAAPLKDMVSSVYGIDRAVIDDPSRKEMPLLHLPVIHSDQSTYSIITRMGTELSSGYWTPRALCILEGSTKRAVRANYWVQNVVETILNNPSQKYVVTDMRYRSEMDTLRMFLPSLETWRIQRFETSPSTDPSERDLDTALFDAYLSNSSTVETLHQLVDGLMEMRDR